MWKSYKNYKFTHLKTSSCYFYIKITLSIKASLNLFKNIFMLLLYEYEANTRFAKCSYLKTSSCYFYIFFINSNSAVTLAFKNIFMLLLYNSLLSTNS